MVQGLQGSTGYLAVSPYWLLPRTRGKFEVYLQQKDTYLHLYRAQEKFSAQRLDKLAAHGVESVHVPASQEKALLKYLEEHLGALLAAGAIPLEIRSQAFLRVAGEISRQIYLKWLPLGLAQGHLVRMRSMVAQAMVFLRRPGALKCLQAGFSTEYRMESHALQVMLYSVSLAISYGLDQKELADLGLGALLHDIGKSRLDPEILDKNDRLSPAELAQVHKHPTIGVGLCARIPLSRIVLNCIMFHHEHMDGGGYPCGLQEPNLPLPARIVGVCNVYDGITSQRSFRRALKPFEALARMRELQNKRFDQEAFTRLVMVLSQTAPA